ncbi:unnamed protein product [Pleuronectes platessa]|uniref:Uncharacterized protein n=1 Tax=Pleuronectes platessa TaxID=8262 RepID=A0A9N7Y0M1_PLEPL|nr:unnamed protein product [Pleuronectes platessa]
MRQGSSTTLCLKGRRGRKSLPAEPTPAQPFSLCACPLVSAAGLIDQPSDGGGCRPAWIGSLAPTLAAVMWPSPASCPVASDVYVEKERTCLFRYLRSSSGVLTLLIKETLEAFKFYFLKLASGPMRAAD